MRYQASILKQWWLWLVASDFGYALGVVAVWRIILELYAIFALYRFSFSDTIHQPLFQLTLWTHYDGGHYISIARKGYELVQYAFFPLFPLSIKIVAWPAVVIWGDKLTFYVVAGLVISTLSLVGVIYFLLRLSKLYFDQAAGRRAVFLLLFFPSAIFLGAVYTESFFLFWVTGAFYFSSQRRWVWAAVFAAAATATRLIGIGMFGCMLLEFWLAYRNQWRQHWRSGMYLLAIPLALAGYLLYQWILVGTPWQFLIAQKAWDRQVTGSAVGAVLNDLRTGLNIFRFDANLVAPLYDALATVLALGLIIILAIKRLWSYCLFVLIATAAPLASGTTVGMIRYVLVMWPGFLLLGWWTRRPSWYSFVLATCTIFFALLSIHYLNTWWLA